MIDSSFNHARTGKSTFYAEPGASEPKSLKSGNFLAHYNDMRGALLVLVLLVAGCDLPKDPDGSLQRIRGGVLRAGFTEAEPWIWEREDGEPGGPEAELIRQFAAEQGARVDWRKGSSEDLLSALEHREIDVFVGGLDEKTPWKKSIGTTAPYFVDRGFLGFPAGHESVASLDGLEVVVEPGSWLIPTLREKGAKPIELDDALDRGVLSAASGWRLALNGYRTGEKPLFERRLIMATAPGENALLVALDTFLLAHKSIVLRLLAQSERPQ